MLQLKPVQAHKPDYPGVPKRLGFWNQLFSTLRTQVTLPLCVVFLLTGTPGFSQQSPQATPGKGVAASADKESPPPAPCKGEMVAPQPPPCKGDMVAPPPCSGKISQPPEPPPCDGFVAPYPDPPPTPPVRYFRMVNLEDFYRNARDYLGMQVRMQGTFDRNSRDSLPGQGFYIFKNDSGNPGGPVFGCPLVGNVETGLTGRRVDVEGIIVKRRPADGSRTVSGSYYALEVERMFLSE